MLAHDQALESHPPTLLAGIVAVVVAVLDPVVQAVAAETNLLHQVVNPAIGFTTFFYHPPRFKPSCPHAIHPCNILASNLDMRSPILNITIKHTT